MAVIFSMALGLSLTALTTLQIAPISPQISEAFHWTEEDEDIFLSATQTAPLIGNALANFLGFMMKDYRPSSVVFLTKAVYLFALSLTLINNTYLFFGARFIMGLALGF